MDRNAAINICRVALAALVMLLSTPAAAAPETHADIFRAVRAFELSDGRSHLAPDATLEFPDLPLTDPSRKRPWRKVPRSRVVYETHVQRMSIAGVWGDRATADARSASRVFYPGVDGPEYSGMTSILSDRLHLRRIDGQWRIVSVVRRVRHIGSDAAWHRREAKRRGASTR